MRNCLIIAREGAQCLDGFGDCVIVTGGAVHVPKKTYNNVLNSTVKEKESTPLGFVKFFDPSEIGIKVTAAEEGVRVTEARTALQAGDMVATVDGTDITSPNSFRRLLRKGLAGGAEITFKVRREDKILSVPVRFKE